MIRPLNGLEQSADEIAISGTLACPEGPVGYSLSFTDVDETRLEFDLTSEDNSLNHLYLGMASDADEAFVGFGAQFTELDMKGKRLPIMVSEQGIGRGAQPITVGADLSAGAGGDWWTSYAPVPHFITTRNRSIALHNHEPTAFDLRKDDVAIVEVYGSHLRGNIYAGDTPKSLIQNHTAWSGRMRSLPDWFHKGAILGLQGGTDTVLEKIKPLREAGTPIAALWLQDWVGQRKTSFGKQLWWSWTLDENRYPGWHELVANQRAKGTEILTYINPFLVDVSEREDGVYRNLYEEARKKGFLITRDGEPYPLTNTSFDAGLIDLTNPKARAWTIDLIRNELAGAGARGWMADFGEALPFDGELQGTKNLRQAHNRYPEIWAEVNREAIEGLEGSDDYVFFMRSAYTRSPGSSTLFWLGDQLVSWDRYDGLKSAVTGLMTGGISGFTLNHSDVGGYTTISHPIRDYHRSKELFMRWAEMNAFSPVFRTHEGNIPEVNHQVYSDPETVRHFDRMTRVFVCWFPYRKSLIEEAASSGLPIIRHPWLEFPNQQNLLNNVFNEFMIGDRLWMAPVTDPDAEAVSVEFPKNSGPWVHLFTGETFNPGKHSVPAPLGTPAVFGVKEDPVTNEIATCLRTLPVLEKQTAN